MKNLPESNGRVGTIGTSYDGFTTLMSLVNPHPALKAAVPINPMVDVWKGDDWFHNGAFRQEMISYVYDQTAAKKSDEEWFSAGYDDYAPSFATARRPPTATRWGWTSCPSGSGLPSIPTMTNIGRIRRSTGSSLERRSASQP